MILLQRVVVVFLPSSARRCIDARGVYDRIDAPIVSQRRVGHGSTGGGRGHVDLNGLDGEAQPPASSPQPRRPHGRCPLAEPITSLGECSPDCLTEAAVRSRHNRNRHWSSPSKRGNHIDKLSTYVMISIVKIRTTIIGSIGLTTRSIGMRATAQAA